MKFLKNFFVLNKNSLTRRPGFFSLGWRFFVGFLLFFYVLTGLSPLDILNRVIASFEEDLEVINLYSTSCEDSAWSDDLNILSVPEVSPDGDKYLFNSLNSASTRDNGSELICSNFLPLVDYSLSREVQELVSEDIDSFDSSQGDSALEAIEGDDVLDIATSSKEVGFVELVASSTNELLNGDDELATSTNALENEENEENQESEEDELGVDSVVEEEDLQDVIEDSDFSTSSEEIVEENDEVFDLEDDLDSNFIEEVEDLASTSDISLLNTFKNFSYDFFDRLSSFKSSLIAKAEEILSKDVENLEELGKFSAAKIKFSAAIIESQIVEVVGVDSENTEQQSTSTEDEIIQEVGDIDTGTSSEKDVVEDDDSMEVDQRDSSASVQDDSFVGGEDELEIDEDSDLLQDDGFIDSSEEVKERDSSASAQNDSSVKVEEIVIDNEEVVEEEEKDAPTQDNSSEEDDDLSWYDILESKIIKNANAQVGNIGFNFWYSIASTSSSADNFWIKFDEFRGDNFSNKNNDGYFSLDASFLTSWADIENLKVKLEVVIDGEQTYEIFVDSLWLEVDYQKASDVEILNQRERWKNALEFLSDVAVLDVDKTGEFRFKYTKNKEYFFDGTLEKIGLFDYWKDVLIEVELVDAQGIVLDVDLNIDFNDDGEFVVTFPAFSQNFKPGKYKLKFHIEDNSGEELEVFDLTQEFSWGVLAINFNKSIYLPGDEAYVQMGVVDDLGHTVCDADLFLEITNPDGVLVELSSASSTDEIITNPECGPDNVIDTPDYYTFYDLDKTGDYTVKLVAVTKNGIREITDIIRVENSLDFEVERIGPTRIYPKADYPMVILINVTDDFKGDIIEHVPGEFKIKNHELKIKNSTSSDPFGSDFKYYEEVVEGVKNLVWHDVELRAGDTLEIRYVFDAPNRSPDLFLLGELSLRGVGATWQSQALSDDVEVIGLPCSARNDSFVENRQWQIASDALNQRVKTVQFIGGVYNGGATAGVNTNTNNALTAFNFRLAESGVDIRNAYVVFESQFEAYDSGGGNYTGYDLVFDTCEESCAADAFFGTNRVIKTDNTVLAYDEGESNQVRLLFDVTSETQLAAYTGNGVLMDAQIGYNIKNGTSKTSIASVKAVLVITYVYDADSENLTNTVVYPLDSTNGTDSGSLQSSIGACTRNSDCPVFDYKMDIPEFPGVATSTNRLSQWFRMYDSNDGNNSNDLDPNINIQTFDIDSTTFHHESVNSGTQGNMPAMLFADWTSSGYEENNVQQLEYYINSGTNYNVGGEVFETYMASSSAAVKTRTVSMPLGVINNGGVTTLTSDELDVYFPENGSATGTVEIKKAWLRIIPNNRNSAVLTTTVSTKVGTNATSSDFVYSYNGGGTVIKPSFNIIHIIPASDYAALEEANASIGIPVQLNTTMNAASFGGVSAELMITYTYSSESTGYLSSVSLIAGQSVTNGNDQSETLTTANSVLPEAGGKTIRAAGLLASYLISDSDLSVGTALTLDANLAISSPSCSNAYNSSADSVNEFTEFYKDVTSAMNTTDSQSYSACYTNNGAGDVDGGAKMNGELIYTYSWDNSPPTGSFNSVLQKSDGTGVVDINIEVADTDGHESTAKIEYVAGDTCDFTTPLDPSLDEADVNITADFGDPNIDNALEFQVGTVDASITTASGSNSVLFDWSSATDVASADGTYCLRLIANDGLLSQTLSATTTVTLDNVNPTAPGTLSLNSRTGTTIDLNFGATSTDTNFYEYRIFYKEHDGTDPDDSDSVLASTSDINLGNVLFNDVATTSIGSLIAHTVYSFSIWTYDLYGNKASSSRVDIETNDAPMSIFNSAIQKTDGSGTVDFSIEVDDFNNDDILRAQLEYEFGSGCLFGSSDIPTLSEVNVSADFGLPVIDNNQVYQVGTNSGYILTSPGSNTIDFDWLALGDEPTADDTYCVRLTTYDGIDNQLVKATTTLIMDNVNPTIPGNLTEAEITFDSIELIFATSTPSTDTNEPVLDAYKVFYLEGSSGVTESDIEIDLSSFDAYDYGVATSTVVGGLSSNTYYTFNIWAYDTFGNKVSATELTLKTNATVSNDSLLFVNPQSSGTSTNIVIADGTTTWTFRAVISETNGWTAIASTTLRLADSADNISPFNDIEFYWDQTADSFYEIGGDSFDAVSISPSSSSSCGANTCTLDFVLVFNKTFDLFSTDYDAEVRTSNDAQVIDNDSYDDIYQVRRILLNQDHYRWRNDDGGE